MPDSPKMAFTQWQPIGVCDDGSLNQMKAKIFAKADLEAVMSSEVTRENWRESAQVMAIIHRYAKDVAKMSSKTQHMKKPVVANVKLVGTILKYGKTPMLNRESQNGKVQFFQVTFKDAGTRKSKKKKSWLWLWITLVLLGLLVMGSLLFLIPGADEDEEPHQSIRLCEARRGSFLYEQHVQQSYDVLLEHTQRLPMSASKAKWVQSCRPAYGGITALEKSLVTCFQRFQQSPDFRRNAELSQVQRCVKRLCQKKIFHIKDKCNQMR